MKIKILKATVCDGKACKAGSVVNASDKDGRFLINTGRAELSETPKKAPAKKKAPVNKQVPVEDIETR